MDIIRCLFSGMVYQNVTMFGVAWSNYVKALDEWKCVDIDRLIAELHMYWEQLQVCDRYHDECYHSNRYHDECYHSNHYHDECYHSNRYHDKCYHSNSYQDECYHSNRYQLDLKARLSTIRAISIVLHLLISSVNAGSVFMAVCNNVYLAAYALESAKV